MITRTPLHTDGVGRLGARWAGWLFGVNDKGAITMFFKAGSRSRRCAACGRRGNSRSRSPVAQTLGAGSLGALALGALALGSGAIGALAIGRLAIKRGAIGRLRVGELSVGHLTVEELSVKHREVVTPSASPPA
jgi:hypothetical protein